ncbi:MAG: aldehyde dehydrogenase family protein [Actinobacteria bacterium]|nr:aldehyde dehydrogenase family protein [Actinomycetota bacterium]
MTTLHPLPIGAERVTTADEIAVRAPYDGAELGRVPAAGPSEVDAAVAAARRAMREPLPAYRRAEILDVAATRLQQRHEEIARSIAGEAAKPLRSARLEAARAVGTFRFAAVEARTLAGDVIAMDGNDAGADKLGFTLRVPIGVVGAISPFNFPLNLVAHKVAPAIAAGCPVVLKPASQTPLTALLLAQILLDECELPPGWLNVVTGGGGTVGSALVDHDGVAMITFTGSPEVGWAIKARAPKKKVGLELGNNAPVIVEPDADLELAATKIVTGGFGYSGQTCISVQRVYAHELVRDELTDLVVSKVGRLVVGDPLDDDTDVSALIDVAERDRVTGWVDEAVAGGAKVAIGGSVAGGVLAPTVLTGVLPEMQVCRGEVFGPVVGIAAYSTLDEAIGLSNDSCYGLQAAIFTRDLGAALTAARSLEFGGVTINEMPTFRTDQMPYGGIKDSGNTREGPHYAVREMTEERMVVIQL